jgi:AraC family transcriptional regulator of adaptative response / DNA-3-methyladenine glycosylase II
VSGFSAVVTTGIYCRPGCAGRPLPANVRPFSLAAAAEAAGYRACLRCRPYRTDPPLSPDGPELVCRAVQLVIDGLLDDHTETELGIRLGISPRHLRRLFAAHLGVTPDQLARSRRAHFARRLLDDTDLSMADVAFASGFRSIRQFNRVCREIFGASPRELRSRRWSSDRLVADGGLALRLPFSGPLDWDAMLNYLARRAIPGIEQVAERTYRRTVIVNHDPGVLEIALGEPADHLVLVCHLPHWEGLIHLVQRVRRMFALDVDLEPAQCHLASDPMIGPLVAATPGLRPPGTWDPFEAAVRTICGQRVSVAAARTILGRITDRHGQRVGGLGRWGLDRTFPEPHVLADAELSGLGLSRARSDALRSLARRVADGQLVLQRGAGLQDFLATLSAQPGLGPWSAQYLALRCGYLDAFPASDLGLRRSFEVLSSRPTSSRDLALAAERWQPWRAVAATHLWFADLPRRQDRRLASPVAGP